MQEYYTQALAAPVENLPTMGTFNIFTQQDSSIINNLPQWGATLRIR